MSISEKLTQLSEAKSAIASAIESKGGTVTGGFSTFAEDISNLPSGGSSEIMTKHNYAEYKVTATYNGGAI